MGKRLWLFLTICLCTVSMAFAQNKVTGVVIEEETGEPVIGASVKVKGFETIGAATDINGRFTLADVPASAKTLVISYIGMQTKEINVKPNVKVSLVSEARSLKDVMVVAFGTSTKEAFTGSAKVVGAEELEKAQVTSVTSALAGAVPGLQLTSSSGAPGSSPTIRIRGFSSINAGQDPLIIVDGAPYSGDLTNLNPADVESMSVLKDAASTALYGARGSNGVIMITTKNGKVGQAPKITVDAKFGWNTRALQHYDVISSPAQYYEMQYTALNNYYTNNGYSAEDAWRAANSALLGNVSDGGLGYNIWNVPEGQLLIGQNGRLNPNATIGRVVSYNGEDYLITPDDWEDVGTRTGIRQEYNISASSASDKTNFYMNLGYLENQGITDASDLKRFTARVRVDNRLKKWLKVGLNASYARFDGNTLGNNGSSTSTGNIWAFTSQMAPIYPAYIRNADGSIKIDANGIQRMDYGDGLNAGCPRPFIYNANPILDTRLNVRNYEGNMSTGHAYADFYLIPGLTATVQATYNLDETRGTYMYNKYYGQFKSDGGTLSKYNQRSYDYNFQQLINYSTTIKDVHNLSVMLGHEYYREYSKYLSAGKTQMFADDVLELDACGVDSKQASSNAASKNIEGFFGRVLYDYDTKYFANLMYRKDASSRFKADNWWGGFWSVGGAWIISKEDFFDVDWVDMLKFKSSIGSQGNDRIGSYLFTDKYVISAANGAFGLAWETKGTEKLRWETNRNFNIGVEFDIFRKLSGSLEFYHRKTIDLLTAVSASPSWGYTSYYDNVGDLYNQGFELELNYNPIKLNNFDWNVTFNISSVKNKITTLHEDNKKTTYYDLAGNEYKGYDSGSFIVAEGASLYTWYTKEYAGVYTEQTYALTGDKTYDPKKAGLSMWYQRKDIEATETEPAKTEIVATTKYSDATYFVTNETTIPKFYGGFGTSLKFYGFDFSINCSYQIGGKQYDSTYAQFMSSPTNASAGYNFHKDLLNSWSSSNSSSDIPRFQYDDLESANMSTRFLTNASYLNIENINLGYTFPKSWLRDAQIESLRVYCAAENVCYFSARKGFDPRQSYSATTNATRYSPIRTVSAGVTVTF